MALSKTVLSAVVVGLVACGADQESRVSATALGAGATDPGQAGGQRSVTVMTRNLYIGGAVEPFFAPGVTLAQIPAMATALWRQVQATNFPERARATADEIEAARPALVGLQEAPLWRTQSPGDAYLPGGGTPATDIAYDFLDILLAELRARDLEYRVVQVHRNVDIEVFTTLGIDVRLTDRDAILARAGVQVEEASQGTYGVNLIPLTAATVGDSPADRTASGLWPSDHAGLIAQIAIEDPRFAAGP